MNIPNKLKTKIINHEFVTEEETNLFLKYIINKTITITNNMYNKKNYNPMYLFYEICYSYNLTEEAYNEKKDYIYAIIDINNKKYLIDINFNNNKLETLNKNKYIEYTENNIKEYLNIIGKKA